MSKTISVFCQLEILPEELRKLVQRILEIQLTDRSSEIGRILFEGISDEVFISLFDEHGLEDDCGIEFSRYGYEIDFDSKHSQEMALFKARQVASAIEGLKNSDVVLVENLQQLLLIKPD